MIFFKGLALAPFLLSLYSFLAINPSFAFSGDGYGDGDGDGSGDYDDYYNDDKKSNDNNNNNNKKDLSDEFVEIMEEVREFKLLSSKEITEVLKDLASKFPSLVTLSTSQQEFDLPKAGSFRDCTFDKDEMEDDGCYNYYLTIEDKVVHPPESESYKSLPEVFLSGAVHGNERVGPTAVVETATLLLEAAHCESLPHPRPSSAGAEGEYVLQLQDATQCRNALLAKGISHTQRRWLARLVSTRRIVLIPTANALGYDRNDRTEAGIDPNRDFPFDVLNPRDCMQTIAGRTINELYRTHLFQISLTFHGGMEVVSYEWGAPTYMNGDSPDDVAQAEIGDGYARFAGGFEGTKQYISGTMNDLVYPVRGGMEDWAYAGSWDPDRVIQCQPDPKLHGPYPREKTIYNDSTLRAFNMLIETSNSKIPQSHLGTTEGLLNYVPNYSGNGHVARNVRLALMAVDIVEPYVSIRALNGVELSDDVVPMRERGVRSNDGNDSGDNEIVSCQKNKMMSVPVGSTEATVVWSVGGGFTVDFTTLHYTHWDDIPSTTDCSGWIMDNYLNLGFEPQSVPAMSGVTHWSKDANRNDGEDLEMTTTFEATIDISNFKAGDKIAVFAMAVLDQDWTEQPSGNRVKPKVPPMSHVVNARTNVNWRHSSAGKIIQGRQEWFSIPLTILISDDNNDGGKTVELSNRFIIPGMVIDKPQSNESAEGIEGLE